MHSIIITVNNIIYNIYYRGNVLRALINGTASSYTNYDLCGIVHGNRGIIQETRGRCDYHIRVKY